MIRIVFALIVMLHGLIHLMGFAKAFRLAEMKQLALDISRPAGVLWLAAALLFAVTAVLVLLNKEWWWMPAIAAILLSQALVVLWWQDAKFGTIANVIILAGAVLGYGSWSFNAASRAELALFAAPPAPEKAVLTRESIAGLPAPVRKWLERSNAVGGEIGRTASLKQKGEMRTSPDGAWMPVTADQRIMTGRPAFIWLAEVTAAPGIHLSARDTYREGKGRMYIRALSLVPVADASGETIDQGAMVRYLAEIVWVPSAAVSDYLRWEETGPNTAKATMTWGGVTASGVFTFDASGDFAGFNARRYYDRKGGATLEEWVIRVEPDGYRVFEGVRIPTKFSVSWRLKDGDFTWYRMEITDIRYND
jgi:hypothetical protein